MASRPTTRTTGTDALDEHIRTVARLEAEQVAAEAELASLQERAGDEVLADESAAVRLSAQMRELRDRIDIIGRAIAAANANLQAERVRLVLLDAEHWDQEATECRAALDKHQDVTAGLLAQLDKHEGKYISAREAADREEVAGVVGVQIDVGRRPASDLLKLAVLRAELRTGICRDVAAGRDPSPALEPHRNLVNGHVAGVPRAELYPPSVWGPDAVLPAPAYVVARQSLAQVARAEAPLIDADRTVGSKA